MMIIGVDYHPSFQSIAFFVEETGECGEQVRGIAIASGEPNNGKGDCFRQSPSQIAVKLRIKCSPALQDWIGLLCNQLH